MVGSKLLDCLIVGGGPAGLTAAIYLARFHLHALVVDAGASRAASIPLTRNHAGFPEGISGRDLLARMQAQAERYGAAVRHAGVDAIERDRDTFLARIGEQAVAARTILLATGVVNRRPPEMPDAVHDDALARGLLRYCPICDGFEVTDKDVAVLGTDERGIAEARFLRSYSERVTLIAPDAPHRLDEAQRSELSRLGIRLIDGPAALAIGETSVMVSAGSRSRSFDTLYPALGSDIRSGLARPLGAEMSDQGCLVVDHHQRTTAAGLYAAGDVVLGLDQISHAMGEGGVAATTIRNDLAQHRPLLR